MKEYKEKLSLERQLKVDKIFSDHSTKCEHCGHTAVVPVYLDHIICNWCGNFIFRSAKDEFVYRFREKEYRERKKSNLENI